MTTAQHPRVADDRARDDLTPGVAKRARIRFRQPVSTTGFVDAAWWPYTSDLTLELPALMDVMWTAGREINRITYQVQAWSPAPRRMRIEGRTVRLGGFATSEPHLVRLSDPWRYERIDVLLVAPDTDPAVAQRIFDMASASEGPYRAEEILERASIAVADPVGRS